VRRKLPTRGWWRERNIINVAWRITCAGTTAHPNLGARCADPRFQVGGAQAISGGGAQSACPRGSSVYLRRVRLLRQRLRHAEIWDVPSGKDYAGKPRPAAIIQGGHCNGTDSVNHLRLYQKFDRDPSILPAGESAAELLSWPSKSRLPPFIHSDPLYGAFEVKGFSLRNCSNVYPYV
jgi:hypothetical protein